jgi:hypothetical protein
MRPSLDVEQKIKLVMEKRKESEGNSVERDGVTVRGVEWIEMDEEAKEDETDRPIVKRWYGRKGEEQILVKCVMVPSS